MRTNFLGLLLFFCGAGLSFSDQLFGSENAKSILTYSWLIPVVFGVIFMADGIFSETAKLKLKIRIKNLEKELEANSLEAK